VATLSCSSRCPVGTLLLSYCGWNSIHSISLLFLLFKGFIEVEAFLGHLVVKEQDGSGRLEGCGWQCRHHLHNCSVSCWSPGLPGVLSCQVHWRELHYDILGWSGNDVCVDELWSYGGRFHFADCEHNWPYSAEHLCFRVLLHHFTQAASWEEDFPHHPPPLCHWHVHHHCRGFERNNSQHWMVGGNHVCCLLLCPTG